MFCLKCGAQMPENAKFCSKCGNAVNGTDASDTPESDRGTDIPYVPDAADANVYTPRKGGANSVLLVLVIVLAAVVVLGGAGAGGFLWYRNHSDFAKAVQVQASAISENEYKSMCSVYNYRELCSKPNEYRGKQSLLTGYVSDVKIKRGKSMLVVQVTRSDNGWTDPIYVLYDGYVTQRQDDLVRLYGEMNGTTKASGQEIPYLIARYVETDTTPGNLPKADLAPTPYAAVPVPDAAALIPNVPAPPANTAGGYAYPSDTRYITYQEMYGMTKEQVALIRNEIYARHGYVFQNETYQQYFSAQPWYVPNADFTEDMLTPIEQTNKSTIVEFEKLQGWR